MSKLGPDITIDPARRGGLACVRDLRITVGDILGWLAQGMTPDHIVDAYPELTLDDIRTSRAYGSLDCSRRFSRQ